MSWRDEQKTRLREHLFETAIKLFERDGYEPVTMAALAQTAGVAKGTYFNHFPAKAAVLQEWYLRESRNALKTASKGTPALDDIETLFMALAGIVEADPGLWQAKVSYGNEPGLLRDAEHALDRQILDFLETRLEAGMDAGELRAGADSEALARHLLAILTQCGRYWPFRPDCRPSDDVSDQLHAYLDLLKA